MKTLLMTTPYFFLEEHRIITALFEEGLEFLHLRKPETQSILSERLLRLIPEKYHKRIIVHDHFYLKEEYNLRGIHLNQRNLDMPKKYKGHVSLTCRNEEEIILYKKKADYVFLADTFDNHAVADRPASFTLQQLKKMQAQGIIDKKVMAYGGIDPSRTKIARELGFGGIVLLGDIWNRFNPQTSPDFNDIITRFRQIRRITD